jgi:DNA-binding CsgD family transcriptional regulator
MMLTTVQLRELFLISQHCLGVKSLSDLAGVYDHFSHIVPFGFAIQVADREAEGAVGGQTGLFNFRIAKDRVDACADQHKALRRFSPMHSCSKSALSVMPLRSCEKPGVLFCYRGEEQAGLSGSYTYLSDASGDDRLLRQSLELLAPHLNAAYQRCAPVADVALTAREKDVLRWLRKGKSNWDISRILDISEHTVKFHLRAVCRKLNVQNRVQVVAFAEKYNLGSL